MVVEEGVGPALMAQTPPLTPSSRAVNIRSVQTVGSTQPHRGRISPARVALAGTASGCVFRRFGHRVSTFLHPFAPPALPGFFATMGALTPGRPALRLPTGHEHRLWRVQVSLRFVIEPSDHSVSNHLPSSRRCSGVFYVGLTGPRCRGRPFGGHASLGLRHSLAGSPRRQAESSSLALRTDRSPPVALHPASRRRSYLRLRSARTPRQGLSPC